MCPGQFFSSAWKRPVPQGEPHFCRPPRWMARFEAHKKWTSEWGSVSEKVDSVLEKLWKSSAKMTLCPFVKLHAKILSLKTDPADIQAVAGCDSEKLSQVKDSLCRLVTHGNVGLLMFGAEVGKSTSHAVRLAIEKVIREFNVQGNVFNSETVAATKAKALAAVGAVANLNLMPRHRQAEGRYRGQAMKAPVASIEAEVSWRISLAWKGLGVQQNVLNKVWFEDLVVPEGAKQGGGATVDPELADAPDVARALMKDVVEDSGVDTGDEIVRTVSNNAARLIMQDREAQVEISLVDLLGGSTSVLRVKTHILQCMPDATAVVEREATLHRLTQLARKDVNKYASITARAKLETAIKIMGRIVDGVCPDLDAVKQCPVLKDFYDRLQFFVRHVPPEGAAAPSAPAVGAAAIRAQLADAAQKHASGVATRADIEDLKVFAHLIPEDISAHVADVIKRVEAADLPSAVKGKKPGKKALTSSQSGAAASAAAKAATCFD
ncbi:unnamed protein product [Prorocentrum cordatum]|uniref:Uncharacterized protein n=1 Tax=Prorocentrum cordatum TaxID=2364126 RepID=A0ABN9XMF7_9DINO|nr:unnamed protein product [Polarella glacialis]